MSEQPRTIDSLNKSIVHNLTPDPSWEPTGEYHTDSAGGRWPVYREKEGVFKTVAKRDEDGLPLYHLRADGSKFRPMTAKRRVSTRVRDFTYVPLGNGIAQKNYNWRPSAAELERKRVETEEAAAQSELTRTLRDAGMGFKDLLAGLRGLIGMSPAPVAAPAAAAPVDEAPPPPPPAPPAVTPAEGKKGRSQKPQAPPPPPRYPAPTGDGSWYLSAEHEEACGTGTAQPFEGSREEAASEAANLVGAAS